MKKEELFEVLGNLEPGMVEKARSDRHPRRGVWKKWTAAAACAVIIGGAVLGVATWRNGREGSAVRYPSGVTTVLAAYPASVERTMDAQKFMESDAHWDWWDSYRELTAKSAELQSGIDAYYQNLMKQMLVSEDENTVCSPINLYIAFAMLAETSDGNTVMQTVASSKNLVTTRLSNVYPLLEVYRECRDGEIEVQLVMGCDRRWASEIAWAVISAEAVQSPSRGGSFSFSLTGLDQAYRNGESLRFSLIAEQDCYYHLFVFDADGVEQLYPGAYEEISLCLLYTSPSPRD